MSSIDVASYDISLVGFMLEERPMAYYNRTHGQGFRYDPRTHLMALVRVLAFLIAGGALISSPGAQDARTSVLSLPISKEAVLQPFVKARVFAKSDMYDLTAALAAGFANHERQGKLRTRAQWRALARRLKQEVGPKETVWLIERPNTPFIIVMAGVDQRLHTIRFIVRNRKISLRNFRTLLRLIGTVYRQAVPGLPNARRWPARALTRSYQAQYALATQVTFAHKGTQKEQISRNIDIAAIFPHRFVGPVGVSAVGVPRGASYLTITSKRRCVTTVKRRRDIARSLVC